MNVLTILAFAKYLNPSILSDFKNQVIFEGYVQNTLDRNDGTSTIPSTLTKKSKYPAAYYALNSDKNETLIYSENERPYYQNGLKKYYPYMVGVNGMALNEGTIIGPDGTIAVTPPMNQIVAHSKYVAAWYLDGGDLYDTDHPVNGTEGELLYPELNTFESNSNLFGLQLFQFGLLALLIQ
eukprot:NODE_723_length_4443_cov_1.043048.p1 type:complete len:181 gc:universal NODE_723_length_4443_cov_1.043048:117-659(+)